MESLLARVGLGALDLTGVITIAALAAARLIPVLTIVPIFGGRLVPGTLRVGLALAFVALAYPVVARGVPAPGELPPLWFGLLLAKEAMIGGILGFLATVPFWAAEAAGRLADNARGAGSQELYVPQLGTQATPLGDVSLQLAVVVFFAVDGHLLFLRALAASYEALPVATLPAGFGTAALPALATQATAQLVLAAVGLAAPILAALVVADVALGLIGRVSPQLQLHFVGMPVRAVLGVLVFCLALGGMVAALRGELGLALRSITQATTVLR